MVDLGDVDISRNRLRNGDIITFDSSGGKFIIGKGSVVNNIDQTLIELLTEQPQKFNFVSSSNTSGLISLEWNYDDILVKDDNNIERFFNTAATLKEKMMPFIDKIHVDISGTIHGLNSPTIPNNEWIPFTLGDYDSNGNKLILSSDNYNTDSYKRLDINKIQSTSLNSLSSFTERILSESESLISFRIYGINNARDTNDLANERALYFNNLKFLSAAAPQRPQFVNENILQNANIILTTKTNETELNNPTTNAKVSKANVSYSEHDRNISNHYLLSSAPFVKNTSPNNISFNFNPPINNNILNTNQSEPFTMTITETRPGTKYKYNVSLVNNLVNTVSDSFEKIGDSFTPPPSTLHLNSLHFNVGDTTSIISDTFEKANKIYVNIRDDPNNIVLNPKISNNSLISSMRNNATIEVSSDFKIGNNLDGVNELVHLNVYINNSKKQEVKFNGYKTLLNTTNFRNLSNIRKIPNTFYFISDETTMDDMFNDTSIANYRDKMGFRLKANIIMNSLTITNIKQNISNSGSITPFTLKYEYIRKGKLYENNTDVITDNSFDIYIDDLRNNPVFSVNSRELPIVNITSLKYCMGIPSVFKFDIIFNTTSANSSRQYENINSNYKFVRGDLKISDISLSGVQTQISKAQTKNINLSNKEEIQSSGSYNLSNTNFQSIVKPYFQNIKYINNSYSNNNKINISEKLYSLKTGDSGISLDVQELNMNHYCDFNSFNNFTSDNPSIKITKTIYEIDNINSFSTNIGSLNTSEYSNHENLVKDSTLLFINGVFQTNIKQQYPDISSFSYQSMTLENTGYTSGLATTAYDLDGTTTGSGKKYKWIGFNFTGTKNSNGQFSFIDYTGTSPFLNIYNNLRSHFNATTFDKLKENNDDVIGIIKINNNVGNLSRNFNKLSPWYGLTSSVSLSSLLSNQNKGTIYTKSSSSWGPVINTSNNTLNIFIFIGLNNSVSL